MTEKTLDQKIILLEEPGEFQSKLFLARHLENEVLISQEEQIVYYTAKVFDLNLDGLDSVKGNFELSKYLAIRKRRVVKEFIGRYFLGLDIPQKEQPLIKGDKVWTIDSREWCGCHWENLFFIEHERSSVGYNFRSDYRGFLIKKAAEKKMVLSPKLLDLIFNPIDTQIMEMYLKTGLASKR